MTDSTTPLGIMTQRGPTALWNDSATKSELATSISWGAVGATCNPVIALSSIRSDLPRWTARIAEVGHEHELLKSPGVFSRLHRAQLELTHGPAGGN